MDGCQAEGLLSEGVHVIEEGVNLLLEARDMVGHATELVRVLEVVGAAVRCIVALQIEVTAPLARRLAIALDLSALAFVTRREGGGRAKISYLPTSPPKLLGAAE